MKFKFDSIYKNFILFYFFSLITLPLGMIVRLFFSRTLSVYDFGILYSLIAFFNFIFLFSNIGLSHSMRYFIPKYSSLNKIEKIKNLFYYSLFIQLFLVLLISIILYFFSNWIVINYFKDFNILIYFKIFILYFIFLNLLTIFEDVFVGYKLNLIYQGSKFLFLFLIFLFSLFFYFYLGPSLFLYSFSWVFSSIFISLIYISLLKFYFPYLFSIPSFNKNLLKKLLKYSYFIFFSVLGFEILGKMDILMLTYFLSPKEVALYSNSFSLILSLISFFGLYSIILQPIFTELYELKNIKKLTIIFQKLYSLFIYILFPFLFLFFYFSEQIMSFIFGSNYLGGSLVLSLYSLFLIFPIINSYNISFINGLNLVKYLPKIIFFIVFLNFFLNLFLIPKFGIIGPVISTIIGWIIFFLFTLKIISNFINISIKRINFLKLFFNVIIFLILVYFLKGFQFFDNYYMNSLFILSISFLFYYLFGNFIGIYRIKDFYILIPEGVLKSKFEKYHKKYFPFLK